LRAIFSLNSSGVRKKYSTPFCSCPRGGRDVQLMEKCIRSSGCSCISQLMIVDLPLPLGAEKMIKLATVSMFLCYGVSVSAL